MFIKKFNTFILIILILITKKLYAEKMLIDNFNNDNQENWEFISDQVMGGVSFGNYEILNEGNTSFLKLTGFVSLENNGTKFISELENSELITSFRMDSFIKVLENLTENDLEISSKNRDFILRNYSSNEIAKHFKSIYETI